ncbi:TBC domain protein, putative [Talaromyces stipitatus ATCC 10500]|uniref:TBC domain protein, putative n=1 Tax=Talaromyces stipitatus (strain ATCC 10500 / CBS 375.48 / QM 6759 / NRRL 1006) TaxID=441959 RepID=B8M642_TALSN|nr:TBC domain protein, putative [Talaromyces stipitatus ATCC 10500]EED19042.1 TBC domain protein, putative [Talaromyces stipitatus ATCC 10500]
MPEPVISVPGIAFEETAPLPFKNKLSRERPATSPSDNRTQLDIANATSEQIDNSMYASNGNELKNGEPPRSVQDNLVDPVPLEEQPSIPSPTNIPSIRVDDASSRPSSRWSERRWGVLKPRKSTESVRPKSATAPNSSDQASFQGITMNIPTTDFQDLTPSSMEFSKRGSLMKANPTTPAISLPNSDPGTSTSPRKRTPNTLRVRQSKLTPRAVSADEDMLSRRVRLMYEKGDDNVTDAEVSRAIAEENGILWEEPSPVEGSLDRFAELNGSTTDFKSIASVGATSSIKRESKELAGGIEDWQNVDAADVDRYGFIVPRSKPGDCAEPQPIQRVSTSLLLASESPRRKNTFRRSAGTVRSSSRSLASKSPTRDRKLSDSSNRPSSSQSAYSPTLKRSPSKFRYAANRLPHNRDRRVRDEAGDMFTLPFEVPAAAEDTPVSTTMKKKEWEREDKWMKMAKPTKKTHDGSGMTFEFDTSSSKLIERTWKGIPDSWRATAWYAFLESSARKHEGSPSAAELISAFHQYQNVSSPDDVQIDIDVPRTISSHIMFRRRYRGGQRLLFRVLHAMSLYFPDTGYVQGMAALTATLLAYYDEENAFVMLARLWMLRGLQHLYREGFSGLMEALNDFEKEWLGNGEVAGKLNELGIPPTSYGTRWYLTLFNYSIPFPAQLRVWDVFMLLGDAELPSSKASANSNRASNSQPEKLVSSFGQGLDVLHATSAALIDGMRDIVLESDFENAMKVLTSWVPIKDIELFMRVARAEYKVHHHRKKHG